MDNTFPIEDGVPVPGNCKFMNTLHSLQVGQSFWAEINIHTARVYVNKASRELNRKFVTRKQRGGIRVWRTI